MVDAIEVLKRDHKILENLLKQFTASEDPYNRRIILNNLIREIELHISVEETILQPHLSTLFPPHAKHHSLDFQQIQKTLHQDLRTHITTLQIWTSKKMDTNKIPATWPPFPTDLIVNIQKHLEEHIKIDQNGFDEMREFLSSDKLQQIAEDIEQAKAILFPDL